MNMLNFQMLQKLVAYSEDKDYPQLIGEWNIVDAARNGDDFYFTMENSLNHCRIAGLRQKDIEYLRECSLEYRTDGFRKLYEFCDLINTRVTENRTDRIVDLLTPQLIDLLSEKCLMAASKYNGGDPSRDIEFLRGIVENRAVKQDDRSRVYSLFTYDSISTRKIASYCSKQSKMAATAAAAGMLN